MIELTEWLRKESNESAFKGFVKTNYLIDYTMLDFDTEGEKEKVLQKIKKDERKEKRGKAWKVLKYAAIFIALIGIGYILNIRNNDFVIQEDSNNIVEVEIRPGIEKAILTLENGEEVVLEKGKQIELKGASHRDNKLVYTENISQKNSSEYNYLTIPKGGQYFVQLEDGTKVWLNSDSKIKYPISFQKEQSRVVELLYGEAYFEVSPSNEHNGATFIVKTGIQEVQVLGTEFNIKAYQDEIDITTTLVEGRVTIGNGIKKTFLKPSEQSIINTENTDLSIKKVDKIFDEIAWKEGYFSFKSKSMKDIMKILSRWYDIDYIFNDPAKESKRFTGVLGRESTIDQILMHLQKTNEIKFTIYDRTVIIE
ncbi:FecR family protein [Flagellimonas sp. 2504JD4-2]